MRAVWLTAAAIGTAGSAFQFLPDTPGRPHQPCPLCSCPSGDVPPSDARIGAAAARLRQQQQQQQQQQPKQHQSHTNAQSTRWGHRDEIDVHPESWALGNGDFANSYLETQRKGGGRPIAGEDPMAIGRALVKSRTDQDRRQDAEDRRVRHQAATAAKPISRASSAAALQTAHASSSMPLMSPPQPLQQTDRAKVPTPAEAAAAAAGARQTQSLRLDSKTLGVGGMDNVVEAIRRRVWVPLSAPKDLLEDLGVAPVSGLLLHGPPGCGKSLLARRLTEILTPRPPTFVSGPEILDRFVGSSEANVRSLFDFPPPLPAGVPGAEEALHVIVLDEFDAIAGRRSAGGGGDGSERVRDSVVNQLLARMDGVQQLATPTLLVGLTNRKDLIDPALLRPGRFEVHIEVAPPDCRGRAEILRIHCHQMWSADRMEIPKWSEGGFTSFLTELAERTEGFSGAELAGVVRAAAAYALERAAMTGYKDAGSIKVTLQDFERGLNDVAPAASTAYRQDTDGPRQPARDMDTARNTVPSQ